MSTESKLFLNTALKELDYAGPSMFGGACIRIYGSFSLYFEDYFGNFRLIVLDCSDLKSEIGRVSHNPEISAHKNVSSIYISLVSYPGFSYLKGKLPMRHLWQNYCNLERSSSSISDCLLVR